MQEQGSGAALSWSMAGAILLCPRVPGGAREVSGSLLEASTL